MSPVRRHLAATARGIVGGADGLEQMLVRRHAERLAERAIAVVEIEPVGAGTQMCCDGDLNRFVPRTRDLEEDLVLALEQNLLIVGATCRVHRAVHRNQLLSTKRRATLPRSSSLCSGCHASVRWGPAANLPGGPVVGHPCASARFIRGRYLGGRLMAPYSLPGLQYRRLIQRLSGLALRHPGLLLPLMAAAWRFRARDWYRRAPFLPLPPREYIAWRLHTAYGDEDAVPPAHEL